MRRLQCEDLSTRRLIVTVGRNNLTLWHNADVLIQAVAAANNNTIVVAHSVGPSIVEAWIENPNVTAVRRARAFALRSAGVYSC